jgi:4-diphosphocytidyl-2-C-methyl-D-erythritol kinase
MSTRVLRLPAPAKLNLFLHVTGRRSDGYHMLETLLVPISHGDEIVLAEQDDRRVARLEGPAEVAPEDDLAVRAARLLQRSCRVERGVAIRVRKRIPLGGGLGGGSSDAATVLLGLNRLWQLGLSRRALMTLALELGADVPFFVFGEPALGRGIGELLAAVSLPPLWFVVLEPPISVATAAVFAAPELTRHSPSAKIQVFPENFGRNDLQSVAIAQFPEIAACLGALADAGAVAAPAVAARMSGAGACVFAAFDAEKDAQRVLSRAEDAGCCSGFVARALCRHPLWEFAAP